MNFFLLRLLIPHFLCDSSTGLLVDWCIDSHFTSTQHSSSTSGSVADLARLAKSKRFFFSTSCCCDSWGLTRVSGGEEMLSVELAPGVCGGVNRPSCSICAGLCCALMYSARR